jgi:hypothetical protein
MKHYRFTISCMCGNVQELDEFDNKVKCDKCGCDLWVTHDYQLKTMTPWITIPVDHYLGNGRNRKNKRVILESCISWEDD